MKINEIFNLIANTPGSNDKKELLKENLNETIQQIFIDTYDTSKNYYVKKFEVVKEGNLTIDNDYIIFHHLLELLSSREVTGNTAVLMIQNTIEDFVKEDQDILIKILKRNLKIGISSENFNSIIGVENSIKKFSVALANKLKDVKNVNIFDGNWWVSRKLDGCRCIAIYDGIDVKFYSRQGKEFKTLDNLKLDIKLLFKDEKITVPYVLDGEICIVDENGDEHFDKIMKEITRKNHTIERPYYQIFDLLNYEEFANNRKSPSFLYRYVELVNKFNKQQFHNITYVPQERITSEDVYKKWQDCSRENNWEGLMIRKNVSYEGKRTNNLLKIKEMDDAEYVVKDLVTGEMTYNENGSKNYNVVTALIIEHKENTVQVGSGLSKEQRINWYNDPSQIIGKTITVQYFEETQDKNGKYSLRFPTLKHVHKNGREV